MKILIIRGGSLGDFILTLPAMMALRRKWPGAHIEIMGHLSTVRLVENLIEGVSSFDQAGLAPFFVEDGQLPENLVNYFSSFNLIVSYIPDGDGLFRKNLLQAGARRVISAPNVVSVRGKHIADQLLEALYSLGVGEGEEQLIFTLEESNRHWASRFWEEKELGSNVVALHPGSGGERKRWEGGRFAQVGDWLQDEFNSRVLIVSGAADEEITEEVICKMRAEPVLLKNLDLRHLASVLQRCRLFIGNDSGVTHLSAILGLPTLAIFGPSEPSIWGPRGEKIIIIRKDISCSPCIDFSSPLVESACQRECLGLISVDEVKDKLVRHFFNSEEQDKCRS